MESLNDWEKIMARRRSTKAQRRGTRKSRRRATDQPTTPEQALQLAEQRRRAQQQKEEAQREIERLDRKERLKAKYKKRQDRRTALVANLQRRIQPATGGCITEGTGVRAPHGTAFRRDTHEPDLFVAIE